MLSSEVPLGILPAGTMNVLARDLGVPDDADDAIRLMRRYPRMRLTIPTAR